MTTDTHSRILVASDSPLEALTIESLLREAGHPDVRITTDGREIAALHGKWPFSVLILDMSITSRSGLDVLNDLCEHMNKHRLAVLALADAGDEVLQERALRAGATDVLTRPFGRTETLVRVGRALLSQNGGAYATPAQVNRRPSSVR